MRSSVLRIDVHELHRKAVWAEKSRCVLILHFGAFLLH